MREPTHFTKDTLPGGMWMHYVKRSLTPAQRIQGPFTVETREGMLTCADGWLAVDTGGWPYPIAVDEFDRIYAPSTLKRREDVAHE